MRHRWIAIALVGMALAVPERGLAGKPAKDATGRDEKAARLVREIMALDPAIVAVRPASVREPGRAHFPIVWMPTLTLRRGTSVEAQLEIVQKAVTYVVRFQGGVPTKDVLGGIIAFIEGEGWEPEIGRVFYRVKTPSAPVEAWVGVRAIDEKDHISCCDDAARIGLISRDRFMGEPTSKILPAVMAVLKSNEEK